MTSCPVAHAHRGGMGDTSRPHPDVLQALGGRPCIERLVETFYDRVQDDADLHLAFRGHAHGPHGRRKLVAFLMGWFGHDPSYSRAQSNGGQQRAHYEVSITHRMAAAWLKLFDASMSHCGVSAGTAKDIMRMLGALARQMVNTEGEVPARGRMRDVASLAAKGDRAGLEELIDDEPTLVRRRGQGGRTLLWEAARNDRLELVQWLLDLGTDVDAPGIGPGGNGKTPPPEKLVMMTPHCVAAVRKNSDVVELLLNAGATVDIYTAAMLGDVEAVEAFIRAEPTSVSAYDPAEDFYPVTPLHHAVCGKRAKVVDALLAGGAEVGCHGVRLLALAFRRGALPIAETLLANGAAARDCASLLNDVVRAGSLDWARLLMDHGADPSRVGVSGKTIVKFPEVAEVMLANGAALAGLRATCYGKRDTDPAYTQALLESGADANGGGGITPLNLAVKSGFTDHVTILLAHGADPNIADDDGRMPFVRALARKRWDIATQFIRAGADHLTEPLNKTRETPLHKAARFGQLDLARALLDAHADPNAATSSGKTAADYARKEGHREIAAALTRAESDRRAALAENGQPSKFR